MDGLHSPWGTIGRIKSERGYTHEYVLWGEAWINLLMETADAPRYTRKKHTPIIESAEELDKIFGKKTTVMGEEPVNIDILLRQNVDEEADKATRGIDKIAQASEEAWKHSKEAIQLQQEVIARLRKEIEPLQAQFNK
jgi:hypothetical protein